MGKKISELTLVSSVNSTDVTPIGRGGSTAYGASMSQIKTYVENGLSTASTSSSGLMSSSDKSKLNGIETGAQVNPSAYVKTVTSTNSSGTKIAEVTLQNNSVVELYAPTSGGGSGSGTITGVKVGDTTIATSGVATIPMASSSVNGAMSSTDKSKMDNIQVSGIKVVSSEVSASDNILYIVLGS